MCIYSLRKFLRLACDGNPSILVLLFATDIVKRDARGEHLQELAPQIVSRKAGRRFLGYMESQRQRLVGERGQKRTNRPDLEERHGFDTKYAMHLLRLGFQGVELMETGRLTLPVPVTEREWLIGVRQGRVTLDEVLQAAGDRERRLKDLLDDAPLRAEPDSEAVEAWMVNMYLQNWKARDRSMFAGHCEGGSPS